MPTHYDRHADTSAAADVTHAGLGSGPDEEAMEEAAEALRQAEVEAVQADSPDVTSLDPSQLDAMNIDELRLVAKELDVPDRAAITDRDELIAAIRHHL